MLERVKIVISGLYNISEIDFVSLRSRQQNIVEARRLYVYFLNKFRGIKHLHMKDYVYGMHHATSIYHCKKLEDLLESKDKKATARFVEFMELIDPVEVKGSFVWTKKKRDIFERINEFQGSKKWKEILRKDFTRPSKK